MKKHLLFEKRFRYQLVLSLVALMLLVAGCFEISSIILPDSVEPNSAFNVRVAVQISSWDRNDPENTHGMLGILLPEGWTVKDSIEYSWDIGDSVGVFNGFVCYNDTVVTFLENNMSQCPSGYYWWGAKSTGLMSLFLTDSTYVDITIFTDSRVDEFNTRFIVGDDSGYNKTRTSDPFGIVDSSDFIPIKVDLFQSASSWRNQEWKVYPNPTNGEITIERGDPDGEVRMKIFDMYGRLQKSAVLYENSSRFDLSAFPKGAYIVALENGREMKTKKLLLQ